MSGAQPKNLAAAMQLMARRLDQGILLAYVRLSPLANHFNLTSPGLVGLAVIAVLPR